MCLNMKADNYILSLCNIIFICLVVAIYSLSGFFTKQASLCEFLSLNYFANLCGVVMTLAVYAVLWQIILKRVPLSKAYMFRSLGVIYGIAIAAFFFKEEITKTNLWGSVIVLLGLLILLSDSK